MEKTCLLRISKMNKYCKCLLLVALCTVTDLFGQQYNLLKHISIDMPQHAIIDPLGQVYLQTIGGRIVKYDENGEILYEYQDANTRFVHTLDASTSLRLLVFYKERQSYQYFDRTLTPSPMLSLTNTSSAFFSLAAASADNSLWLWDATQLRLKKYKPVLNDFTTDISAKYYLAKDADINQMSEYQNKLYVNDHKNEILVFDLLGNYIQKLPLAAIEHVDFSGDELYWRNGRSVHTYNLYNMQSSTLVLPDDLNANSIFAVFLKKDRMIIITQKEMLIYRLLSR